MSHMVIKHAFTPRGNLPIVEGGLFADRFPVDGLHGTFKLRLGGGLRRNHGRGILRSVGRHAGKLGRASGVRGRQLRRGVSRGFILGKLGGASPSVGRRCLSGLLCRCELRGRGSLRRRAWIPATWE